MHLYRNHAFLASTAAGILLLAASLVAVFLSTNYINARASNAVTDIVLSNTQAYDVDGIFVYGALLLVAGITVLVIITPRYLPFTLKAIAFLYFIRSLFVSLTHLSPFPDRIAIDAGAYLVSTRFFQVFFSGNDLFFSGHVALPFLLALIFWEHRVLRAVFLVSSFLFAVVVLLGHLHYSIDVFSAYFITYSLYVLARRLFRRDFRRIAEESAPVV